jgi:hypothetical protein
MATAFRVTHPFHPLSGRQFELIGCRSRWGDERVWFHDPAGRLSLIPRAWTDLAPLDPFVTLAAGRSWFRVEELLDLARLVKGLKP